MLFFLLAKLAMAHHPKPVWTESVVGGYRLVKWARDIPKPEDYDHVETLYLKDSKGRVVTTVTDCFVGADGNFWEPKPVDISDVNKDGVPDILLEGWSGGAHGSNTFYLWSLGKHPRCLLAYDKNNVSDQYDFDFKDLDDDGVPEIRSWYDGYAYTVGSSYWPNLPIVLRYERGRFVDRTSRYPKVLRQAMHSAWNSLDKSDLKAEPASWGGPASDAYTLIALGDMMGTRAQVWAELRKKLPKRTFAWLKKREPTILRIIRGRTNRYAYPEAYKPGPVKIPIFPTDAIVAPLRR